MPSSLVLKEHADRVRDATTLDELKHVLQAAFNDIGRVLIDIEQIAEVAKIDSEDALRKVRAK